MTSLRDVDEAAWIEAAYKMRGTRAYQPSVNEAQFKRVMDVVRGQRAIVSETDGEDQGGTDGGRN